MGPGRTIATSIHEIVEGAGLHAGEEAHLSPALHLEDPQRIGLAEHVVDGRVLRGHAGEIEPAAMVGGEKLEALAKAAQHAEPEHVHLEDPERLEVVLVPLDHGAPGHRGGADRNHLVEPSLADDEPPGMLGEVARKSDEGPGHGEGMPQPGRPRIEPEGPHRLVARHLAAGVGGQHGGHLLGQPERLARLAEREPGPEVDHRRGERGAVPAPPLVHVLDHLLPALVLEVDVDVRRLAPLLRHEAFEEEIAPGRIDGGDPEHVAHRGVGGRPPPLGEDPARAREADEVVHGEEVGCVTEPGDDPELALDLDLYPGGDPGTVTFDRPLAHRPLQPDHGGASVRTRLVRIVEAELVEGEVDLPRNVQGRPHRLGTVPEEMGHLGRRLEPALGILEQVETHLVDAPPGAKTGEHVGDGTPARLVHEDRVGRDERHPGRPGGARHPFFRAAVRWRGEQTAKREPHLSGEGRSPRGEGPDEVRFRTDRRQHDERHPLRCGEEVPGADPPDPGSAFASALAFVPVPVSAPGLTSLAADGLASVPASSPRPRLAPLPPLSFGQESGQPAVGGPIARIGEHGRRVHEIEPGPDERSHTHRSRRRVNPHRSGERVVVGDADCLQTELRGLPDELLGMGGAPQEGVVRDRLQLHVAGGIPPGAAGTGNSARAAGGAHAPRTPPQGKSPCRNQRPAAPGCSSR